MEAIRRGFSRGPIPELSERIVGIVLLALLAAAVLVAAYEPGWLLAAVPGCWFHRLTGWNCPFCGMTRDFVALLHGSWNLRNPCSVPLFVLLFVAYPIAGVLALLGRMGPVRVSVSEKTVLLLLAGMFVLNNWSRFGG